MLKGFSLCPFTIRDFIAGLHLSTSHSQFYHSSVCQELFLGFSTQERDSAWGWNCHLLLKTKKMKRGFSPECVCPPFCLFVFVLYTSLYLRSIVASPRPTRAFRLSPGVTELVLGWTNTAQRTMNPRDSHLNLLFVWIERALSDKRRTKMGTESRVRTSLGSHPARCPPAKYSCALAHARTRTHLRGEQLVLLRYFKSIPEALAIM